jgi:hypothetical protein
MVSSRCEGFLEMKPWPAQDVAVHPGNSEQGVIDGDDL